MSVDQVLTWDHTNHTNTMNTFHHPTAEAAYNPYNTYESGMSPTNTTYSKTSDYAHEYLKELLEKVEREKYEKEQSITPDNRQTNHYYNNCVVNSSTFYNTPTIEAQDLFTNGRVDSCNKSSILSRFYKPDGTPVKGLWENETNTNEQRTYKYEPKPLERRKAARSFVPDEKKSDEYWEKRKKNNAAARKSREDRRKKEIEILKSVDLLKNDNMKLKIYAQKVMNENQNLKYEIDMLKRL